MQKNELFEVLAAFGLVSGEVEIHKGVFRVSTPSGEKCIKRVSFGPEDISFIACAMQHLSDFGFSNIAYYEKAPSGLPYVEVNNSFFVMTPWVRGRESDYTHLPDLALATKALAEFHQAGLEFQPPPCKSRIRWGKWLEIFKTRMSEFENFLKEAKNCARPFDMEYLANAPYYLEQGYHAIYLLQNSPYDELSASSRQQGAICHHDYAYHNVIQTKENGVFLVDFDYCICDLPCHDLASLIIRTLKWSNWNFKKVNLIMNLYNSLNPLPQGTIPVMNAFFTFPQDFWQLGVWRYMEKMPWLEKSFLRKLNRVLQMKKGRERFLQSFADNYL